MYNFTRMPANGIRQFFVLSEATAPKPKTIVHSFTCKTLVRAVKLTVIIMLAGLLQVSARTTAQTRISINMRGATLEKVFSEIEKRSGYTVFYNTEVLKAAGASLVSLDVKDATIEDVMHQCLKGLPLEFLVQDKTIFVKKEIRRAVIESAVGPGSPIPSTFSGIVRNEAGAPLPGASVYVMKLKKTLQTNKDGEFTLKDVPDGEYEVIISFIGYENYRTKVSVANHEAWLSADLKQSMSKLDETVVKGYYSTTNRLNTGDVTTVKGEDIQKQPVSDPMLALEGRVPGLYIQQTSGVPGAYSTIRIRGQNSIANGSNPLYIVDGVPYSSTSPTSPIIGGGVLGIPPAAQPNITGIGASPFNDLNPADIESIEILKDADATAIYGSRGANGVILITTKKGKAGRTQFDLNAFSGVGKVTKFLKLMNTDDYLEMRHQALQNDGKATGLTDYDLNGEWDTTRYTNWQKVLIGNTAKFNSLQGSLSGGNSNTQFLVGAAFSNQGTVYPGNFSDQKGAVNLNLTHSSSDQRLHAQLTSGYINDNSNLPQLDYTSYVTLAPDAPALYAGNGNLNWQALNGTATWTNPLSYNLYQASSKTNNLISNLNLSYLLLRGLQVKTNFGYSHLQNNETNFIPAAAYAPPNNNNSLYRSNNFSTTDFKTWIIEPQITYEKSIAAGKLNALLGITFQQNDQNAIGYQTHGYSSDALISDPLAAASSNLAGYQNILYRYNAFFGRINYDWQEKYLINITARRDGSSRFGPGRQFGNFGAIGAGWVFSKENLIQHNLSFLSFGKLRASYGSTGNDQITDYQFLSTYTPYSPTYQNITGLYPTSIANPNYGWELVKKLEGGIELGFIKDRILLSANYYRDRTGNQLVGYPLPRLSGFSTVQANLPAVLQNSGGEFTLNTVNIRSSTVIWSSSLNLTIPRNKLISYPNLATSSYANTYVIGKSIFVMKTFHVVGVNDTTGVYQYASAKGPTDDPNFPQDLKVTKPITQNWYGGFDNKIEYSGFELDFLFQFVKQIGHNYLFTSGYSAGQFNINYPTAVLSRWQAPGYVSNYGRFSTKTASDPYGNLHYGSDFGVADASFVRLKNLALSYRLSKELLQKMHLQAGRFYIQCQNLLTITNYFGLDPETQGKILPPLRMITGGLQLSL